MVLSGWMRAPCKVASGYQEMVVLAKPASLEVEAAAEVALEALAMKTGVFVVSIADLAVVGAAQGAVVAPAGLVVVEVVQA